MNRIFLNLKRFDITPDRGGVNRLAPPRKWAEYIVRETIALNELDGEFVSFFPEAHLVSACNAVDKTGSKMMIGCQGCIASDTAVGGNFGAFTSQLPANSAVGIGCAWALIGHCEERASKAGLLSLGGGDCSVINRVLNEEIKAAQAAGLNVLYCIGEKEEEINRWREVLHTQLHEGLNSTDLSRLCIAYEPIWAIGVGKTPPDRQRIRETAKEIKRMVDLQVIYGGGLSQNNAGMLASIPEIDGCLIALTRFSGEVGFCPDEFLEISRLFIEERKRL